jgi:AcrR family transcriptional regulator
MAEVSRRAGVTRALLYRHFSGRDDLIVGVAGQVMDRYVAEVVARFTPTDDVGHLITESLVFVSTVVARDPLLKVLASPHHDGVARLLTDSPALRSRLSDLYGHVLVVYGESLRPGLIPADVGQYILSVALALLIGAVSGSGEADVVRRYVQTFVLPAILAVPPRPRQVFGAVPRGQATQRANLSPPSAPSAED